VIRNRLAPCCAIAFCVGCDLLVHPVTFGTGTGGAPTPMASSSSSAGGAATSSPASSSSSPCGDTSASDENCGYCGHLCTVGHCKAGDCEPVVIAHGQVAAGKYHRLFVDPGPQGTVYFARQSPGALFSVSKQPPSAVTQWVDMTQDGGELFDLTADDQGLYFSNYNDSSSAPTHARGFYFIGLDGTGLTECFGSGLWGPSFVRALGDHKSLVVSTAFDHIVIGSSWINGYYPLTAWVSDPGTLPVNTGLTGFATDGTWAYYDDPAAGITRVHVGLPKDPPHVLYPDHGTVAASLSGTSLYWITTTGLMRGTTDGGLATPESFAAVSELSGVADSPAGTIPHFFYFADAHNIYRTPGALSVAIQINHIEKTIGAIAVDSASIYWLELDTGAVLRKSL